MIDKHINEEFKDIKLIALSTKQANGYLSYYWCQCKCGNIKRYRYDQARRVGNCGMCEDFKESGVLRVLGVLNNGEE